MNGDDPLSPLLDRYTLVPGRPGLAVGLPSRGPVPQSEGGDGHLEQGWRCLAAGDYEGAVETFRRALKLAADDPSVLSAIGWTQAMSQEYDEALITYHHLLVVRPEDTLASVNLGYTCLRKGTYAEAIEDPSKPIRIAADPKTGLCGRCYLGLTYMAREMYSDAESLLLETVGLDSSMSEAFFPLGRARFLAGREADAVASSMLD